MQLASTKNNRIRSSSLDSYTGIIHNSNENSNLTQCPASNMPITQNVTSQFYNSVGKPPAPDPPPSPPAVPAR